MSPKVIQTLKKYIANPQFDVNKIEKVSVAAKSLCQWVHAIVHYNEVYQTVAPKQAKLQKSTSELEESKRKLEKKRQELSDVEQKLNLLRKQYDEKKAEGIKLKNKIKDTKLRLQRAEKLISGLAAEQEQWSLSIQELDEAMLYVIGVSLLSSASLSYLGVSIILLLNILIFLQAFTLPYRQQLVTLWTEYCIEKKIKLPIRFKLSDALSDPLHVHEWATMGLPSGN